MSKGKAAASTFTTSAESPDSRRRGFRRACCVGYKRVRRGRVRHACVLLETPAGAQIAAQTGSECPSDWQLQKQHTLFAARRKCNRSKSDSLTRAGLPSFHEMPTA